MRDYEVVYIFKSTLGTEDIDARLQRYHEKVLAVEGSEITAVEHWGKRQLAYPIDRNENGYYVVAQFSTEPGALPEFERLLKLDDEVLRHLVVLSEGELAVPISLSDDDDAGDLRRRGHADDAGGTDNDEDVKTAAADDTNDEEADGDVGEEDVGEEDAGEEDAGDEDDSGAASDEDTDEEDKD